MYVNICKVQVWNVKKNPAHFISCCAPKEQITHNGVSLPILAAADKTQISDPSSPAHLFRISRRTRNLRDSMIHKILPNLSWSAAKMCLFYCWIALKPSKCFCFQTDTSQGVVEKPWNSYQGGTLTSIVTFKTGITRCLFKIFSSNLHHRPNAITNHTFSLYNLSILQCDLMSIQDDVSTTK